MLDLECSIDVGAAEVALHCFPCRKLVLKLWSRALVHVSVLRQLGSTHVLQHSDHGHCLTSIFKLHYDFCVF